MGSGNSGGLGFNGFNCGRFYSVTNQILLKMERIFFQLAIPRSLLRGGSFIEFWAKLIQLL